MLLLTNASPILCFGHSTGTQINALIATTGVPAELIRPAHVLPALIDILFKQNQKKGKKSRIGLNYVMKLPCVHTLNHFMHMDQPAQFLLPLAFSTA